MVHTKGEDNEERKVYFNKIPGGFPLVNLLEHDYGVSMVKTVKKKYEGLKFSEINRTD